MVTAEQIAAARQALQQEIALYGRMVMLADQSLGMLDEGAGVAQLVALLEEKRGLLREAHALRAASRPAREICRDGLPQGAAALFLELDRLTAQLESVLESAMEKESTVDRRLQMMFRPAAHPAWREAAYGRQEVPCPRLVSIG